MSEIKRYSVGNIDVGDGQRIGPVVREEPDGRWVEHSAHAEAIARVEAANELLRAEVAEWNDPDSPHRQALMEQIIFGIGQGNRSEIDLREDQLDATEAALAIASVQLATTRERLDAMREFVRQVIESSFEGADFDGAYAQGEALRLGLIEEVPGGFDPEVHDDPSGACEPGDRFYRLAAAIRKEPE